MHRHIMYTPTVDKFYYLKNVWLLKRTAGMRKVIQLPKKLLVSWD